MPQFYSSYQRAAPLPKRPAPIAVCFHLTLTTDYFEESYHRKGSYRGPAQSMDRKSHLWCYLLWSGRASARYWVVILHDISGRGAMSDANILDTRAYGIGRSRFTLPLSNSCPNICLNFCSATCQLFGSFTIPPTKRSNLVTTTIIGTVVVVIQFVRVEIIASICLCYDSTWKYFHLLFQTTGRQSRMQGCTTCQMTWIEIINLGYLWTHQIARSLSAGDCLSVCSVRNFARISHFSPSPGSHPWESCRIRCLLLAEAISSLMLAASARFCESS